MKPIGLAPGPFAEILRRSHCAHQRVDEPNHVCIGRCTITREGVQLDCAACGAGGDQLAPTERESRYARTVVEAIGMSWSSLTPEIQHAAVSALDRLRSKE